MQTALLVLGLLILSVSLAFVCVRLSMANRRLAQFAPIVDLESHKANLQSQVQAAAKWLPQVRSAADLTRQTAQSKKQLKQYQSLLPRFKAMVELQDHVASLEAKAATLREEAEQWHAQVAESENRLRELATEHESVEEAIEIQSFGFYRPKYDFEDSQRYAHELDRIRKEQKFLVKNQQATHCPTSWTVDGSASKGRAMVNEQAKLMLRAFNGECDAAIGRVKYNNANTLEARINRAFEAINKLGKSKQLWITEQYLKLKLQELYLVHEHRQKLQEEKEEQQRIRDQMREEEKVQKEIHKATRMAEKEESTATEALERARQELQTAAGEQTAAMQTLIEKLEFQLKDALERKAKAIARAQLTRSGHVYVLSNVGAFGEGVFKIGLTRRLEPLERVKELGSASVPFAFDVHAMIYSEDAPALEKKLHDHFATRRLNLVNLRREFFQVSLDEIRAAVDEHFGVVTFVRVPEAEEYRQTLALLEEQRCAGESERTVVRPSSRTGRAALVG